MSSAVRPPVPNIKGRSFAERVPVASASLDPAVGVSKWRTADGQIMEIVGQLNQDPEVWASLAKRFRLDIFCGLFMAKRSEGLSLSPEALLALGTRQIELGLCLYDLTEDSTAQ